MEGVESLRPGLAVAVSALAALAILRLDHRPDLRETCTFVAAVLKVASAQIDRRAVAVLAQRPALKIGEQRAGDGVGDDERGRGQKIHPHLRVDASLEITVAGNHGTDRETAILDGSRHRCRQRTRVAATGGAAEARDMKAERIEVVL